MGESVEHVVTATAGAFGDRLDALRSVLSTVKGERVKAVELRGDGFRVEFFEPPQEWTISGGLPGVAAREPTEEELETWSSEPSKPAASTRTTEGGEAW